MGGTCHGINERDSKGTLRKAQFTLELRKSEVRWGFPESERQRLWMAKKKRNHGGPSGHQETWEINRYQRGKCSEGKKDDKRTLWKKIGIPAKNNTEDWRTDLVWMVGKESEKKSP